ncbi:MAG: hypothetical protein U5K84_00680 [Alkalibacterium sp.]|nr:hypothetical protein [Alkalibacterium sp.]
MKKAKKAGTYITFDPNVRPALWETEEEMIRASMIWHRLLMLSCLESLKGNNCMGSENVEDIAEFYIKNGARGSDHQER